MTKPEHTKTGNCWHESVAWKNGEMMDVCDKHDEPRGDCSVCPPCKACLDEEENPQP